MEYKRENIDFQLPNNKTTLDFLKLSKSDRQKVIELGMQFLRLGNNYLHSFNNEQWKKKIDTIRGEKDKIMSIMGACLINLGPGTIAGNIADRSGGSSLVKNNLNPLI